MKPKSSINGHRILREDAFMSHWAAILEEWPLTLERYARVDEGDAGYWHTEASIVSFLSASAWRSGAVAINESVVEKKRGNKTHRGRADLYIASAEGGEYVEAKAWKISCNKRRKTVGSFVADIKKLALADAISTGKGAKFPCLAAAFLSPTWPIEELTAKDDISKVVSDFIEEILEEQAHITAWSFPEHNRHLQEDGWYWPGVTMLVWNPNLS